MTQVAACTRCGRPMPAGAGVGVCSSCGGPTPAAPAVDRRDDAAPGTTITESYGTIDYVETSSGTSDGSTPTIPGYDLLEVIGHGGMGMVWKARQHGTDRLVAIKLILEEKASGRARQRFELEAKALARLQHPHIVQIFEVGDAPGGPFFSMEYVAGGSLAEHVKREPLSPEEAARLVETMAEAIEAAHRAGVLHRDLKPSNVLLSVAPGRPLAADGQPAAPPALIPKISDFGLAKTLEAQEGQTPTGAVLGTLNYMAPEQASGQSKDVGPAADVYGLGATLYELLTGRPPFRGADTLVQVLTKEPEPPGQVRRGVPRVLEAICLKCLEKDPKLRYATAASLAEDLARWRRGESTLARPQTRVKRAWRFVRRHPLASIAAIALFAVAAVALVLPYLDSDRELKRIERKLRRGESVTLVGETGLPKWWRWERGAMQLSPVSGNDGSFSIKTEKDSSLMLLPESVVPRSFRLRAQVRHDNATSRGGEVGIYFFRQTDQISENLRAVSSHRITFNDTPFPGLKGPVKALPQFMIYRAQVSLERSGETPIPSSANLANLQFRPADPESPRPWREVILEVTPAGVRCFGAVEGKSRRAFEPELITIRLARERMQKEQARLPASLGLPDLWPDRAFTRGSLGLCVSAGEASFRNVVIEPLQP